MNYRDFFLAATGNEPYPYQLRWAGNPPEEAEIPTGLGKTEASTLPWWFDRLVRPEQTPRRLVYCLPQRSLVEQTADRLTKINERLTRANVEPMPDPQTVMGGFVDDEWMKHPEKPAIIIGTQDMLLSRALNRGYGMSRYQWPMVYGALNNDTLWIVDEVQLQGVGARTAAQLQVFRDAFGTVGPTKTIFMSATLDKRLIATPDRASRKVFMLDEQDRRAPKIAERLEAQKTLVAARTPDLAELGVLVHREHIDGSLTLAIVNTVAKAQELYKALASQVPAENLVLVHSRFRSRDRAMHAKRLTDYQPGRDLIAVCTQVVEAGLDINANTLVTELAPWSSMVQRFGRCNRNGKLANARCFWVDPGDDIDRKRAIPYEAHDLTKARERLLSLEGRSVGPSDLPVVISDQIKPVATLRRVDFIDLFDTTSDMLGNDIDVGQFIRETDDDFSVMVFWRTTTPERRDPPRREELCAAPIGAIKRLIERAKGSGHADWVRVVDRFSTDDSAWAAVTSSEIHPGDVVWLHCDVGGYEQGLGFTLDTKKVSAVPEIIARIPIELRTECYEISGDPLSEALRISITQHGRETRDAAGLLVAGLVENHAFSDAILTAALWHDVGKGHEVFQETMYGKNEPVDHAALLAKSIHGGGRHSRPYFRHEVASALAFINAEGENPSCDLIAYLICSHHGKARLTVQPVPGELGDGESRSIMGLRAGERLPRVDLGDGVASPEMTIDLSIFDIGSTDGTKVWIDRTTALRDALEIGPFRLAFFELLVRLSDWRASALHRK